MSWPNGPEGTIRRGADRGDIGGQNSSVPGPQLELPYASYVRIENLFAEIEKKFRRSSRTDLSFYFDHGGVRHKMTLSRPFRGSRHVERSKLRDASFHGLTLTEHKIASAVALGLSNHQIASVRGSSKRTVDRHVSTILFRLGFENRAQLASFIAAVDGWIVPFPVSTTLETAVPVLGMLGNSPGPSSVDATAEAKPTTLIVGSLLPSDVERSVDALAMSRGEELAAHGVMGDRGKEDRFPVRVSRQFVSELEIEATIDTLVASGIQALMLGNFSIPAAMRILKSEQLAGIPVVHSMVNRHVDVFADPHPEYGHIFKMCADEFVYLRALSAYIRAYSPDVRRIAVLMRDVNDHEVVRALNGGRAVNEDFELLVVALGEQRDDFAEVALELLHFSPDIIYLGVFVETALVELVSKIRRLLPWPRLFSVWVPGIPGFIQRNPAIAEGLIWSTLVGNSNNYYGVRFRAAFEAEYRSDPGIGAAAVHFDMVNLLRRAWQNSGVAPSPGELTQALSDIQFTGVTGTFHFENGRRRTLCHPFDTDDPSIGQPCLTFEVKRGRSISLPLPGPN